jgi:hypothetical protein
LQLARRCEIISRALPHQGKSAPVQCFSLLERGWTPKGS